MTVWPEPPPEEALTPQIRQRSLHANLIVVAADTPDNVYVKNSCVLSGVIVYVVDVPETPLFACRSCALEGEIVTPVASVDKVKVLDFPLQPAACRVNVVVPDGTSMLKSPALPFEPSFIALYSVSDIEAFAEVALVPPEVLSVTLLV